MRIEHMLAARVGGRGRDREIPGLEHGGDLVPCQRMLDANAPAAADHAHVAAGAERELLEAGVE